MTTASNLQRLVLSLEEAGVLRTPAIKAALEAVDRADFVLPEMLSVAYQDDALPIGFGQTISQPFTVVFMLELLEVQRRQRVLDVGSGSGWTTALLAELIGKEGRVIGVERVPELVAFGQDNLAKYDYTQAHIEQVGEELGWREGAPFDRILVSAAAASLPRPLIDQLSVGGIMVVPVEEAILKVEKLSEAEVRIEKYEGFSFVPLLV